VAEDAEGLGSAGLSVLVYCVMQNTYYVGRPLPGGRGSGGLKIIRLGTEPRPRSGFRLKRDLRNIARSTLEAYVLETLWNYLLFYWTAGLN
jgi:hypothetical protein